MPWLNQLRLRLALFASLAAAWAVQCGDATADLKLATDPAPFPKPANVRVVIGQTVLLPLNASHKDNSRVLFGIIEQPKLGKLSEVKLDASNPHGGSVIYTPNADAKVGTDRFTFNAKVEGGKASKSVAYTIELIAPTAHLKIEPVLQFNKVEIGTTLTVPLKVKNVGTATFFHVVRPPAPWSVAADQQRLEIKPGEEASIDISFTPVDQKPQKHLLLLQVGNPEGQVVFAGAGSPPFSLLNSNLELEWDEASGLRKGVFRVKNLTKRPLPLLVEASEGVTTAGDVVLEPEQTAEVPVSMKGIHAARGTIALRSKNLSDSLPVTARATPAQLQVVRPQVDRQFMFALKDSEISPVYEIEVINHGGKAAFIYAETSRPFRVVEGAKPLGIASGKSLTFKVDVDPQIVGNYSSPLKILGASAPIEFALVAEISRDLESGRNDVVVPELPDAMTKEEVRLHGAIDTVEDRIYGVTETSRNVVESVPMVGQIYLEKQGSRKLVLSWEHPGSSANSYIVEVEHSEIGASGMPRVIWKQAPEEYAKYTSDDTHAKVTLKKLRPGFSFRIRVITVNDAGQTSVPTRGQLVHTLPRGKMHYWLALPLFLVVSGGGFYFWRRRQHF